MVAYRSSRAGWLAAILVLAGCSPPGDDAIVPKQAAGATPPAAPLVEVVHPRLGSIRDTLTLNGDLQADAAIDLTSRIAGVVNAVRAREGGAVREGESLVEIDDREFQLTAREMECAHRDAIQRASAYELALEEAASSERLQGLSLEQAEKEFSRFDQLRASGASSAFSDEEYDAKKFAVETARVTREKMRLARARAEVDKQLGDLAVEKTLVAWDRAKLDLERCAIRAPIDGEVAFLEVRPGELVQSGTLVATVVDRDLVYTEVRVPQRRLPDLDVGQPVEIRTELDPGRAFAGRVDVIHPTVDAREGTVKVRIAIDGVDGALRPGLYVTATIVTVTHDSALLVPKRARLFENDRSVVFVVREGRARQLELATGLQTVDELQVLPGPVDPLRPDDLLVVRGQNGLTDGVEVEIHAPTPAEAPPSDEATSQNRSATPQAEPGKG